jgi:hypothetical protein
MDRKSFFKNILLGIGAAILPNAVLKSQKTEDNGSQDSIISGPGIPFDDNTTLFYQMQAQMEREGKVVKTNKFYWAEYDSDNHFKVVSGPSGYSPSTISIRLPKVNKG